MSHYCTQCISFFTKIDYNADNDYGSTAATENSTDNDSNWNSAATTWQKKPVCYFVTTKKEKTTN